MNERKIEKKNVGVTIFTGFVKNTKKKNKKKTKKTKTYNK